jgi:hypothetical protein
MPELCPESWGHSGDQGEQRTSGGPARLVPLGGQGEWVPSHRVCVRKGCLELSHICFLNTVPVLNTFLCCDNCGRDSDCGYLPYYIWMIAWSGLGLSPWGFRWWYTPFRSASRTFDAFWLPIFGRLRAEFLEADRGKSERSGRRSVEGHLRSIPHECRTFSFVSPGRVLALSRPRNLA